MRAKDLRVAVLVTHNIKDAHIAPRRGIVQVDVRLKERSGLRGVFRSERIDGCVRGMVGRLGGARRDRDAALSWRSIMVETKKSVRKKCFWRGTCQVAPRYVALVLVGYGKVKKRCAGHSPRVHLEQFSVASNSRQARCARRH